MSDGYLVVRAGERFVAQTSLASLEAGINGANLVLGECEPVREYFEGMARIISQYSMDAISQALRPESE